MAAASRTEKNDAKCLRPRSRDFQWRVLQQLLPAHVDGTARVSRVKFYSWSENQISTEVEAKVDIGLLAELT